MRQPDNLPAFCRVHSNGRPLTGQIRTAARTDRPDQVPRPVIKRRTITRANGGSGAVPGRTSDHRRLARCRLGERAAATLRQASSGATMLTWQDAVHDGPVPAGPRHALP
jgi:hypothetical protein